MRLVRSHVLNEVTKVLNYFYKSEENERKMGENIENKEKPVRTAQTGINAQGKSPPSSTGQANTPVAQTVL